MFETDKLRIRRLNIFTNWTHIYQGLPWIMLPWKHLKSRIDTASWSMNCLNEFWLWFKLILLFFQYIYFFYSWQVSVCYRLVTMFWQLIHACFPIGPTRILKVYVQKQLAKHSFSYLGTKTQSHTVISVDQIMLDVWQF